jgi:hypothetical protein
MVRIAKKPDFKRLEDLKKKINDEKYLDAAIQRIAQQLSKELIGKD